jgi:hypothetical protein
MKKQIVKRENVNREDVKREKRSEGDARTWTIIGVIALLLTFHVSRFASGAPMVPEFSESGVPQSQIDVLTSLYADAAAKLREIVLHPPGKTVNAQQFNSARAAAQLRQIDEILVSLNYAAAGWIGDAVPQAMIDGITRGNQQSRDAGLLPDGSPIQGSFSLIDHGTARIFASEIARDLQKASGSLTANAKSALIATRQHALSESDIDKILAGGAILGTPVQTIRTLREALRAVAGDTITIQGKNGPIDFEVGYYAGLVARTKTRQATIVSRHDRLSKLGIDLVSIIGRVSKNFCTAYLGEVYSLSGTSSKYPALSSLPGGGPPFHPQCSKSTRAFVEDLADETELANADGGEDQEQMLGIDAAEAQRRFKDLQLFNSVKERYAVSR